jgi:hypothetical protein
LLGPVGVLVVVVGDVVVVVGVVVVVVVGDVVVVVGDVVVVVGVVVVVVVVVVDPGVVVEVDVGDVVVVVGSVVVVEVPVEPQVDGRTCVIEVTDSVSGGFACAATSAGVAGTELGIDTISVDPSSKYTATHLEAALTPAGAVAVSADATGIAHNPNPTRNVERATSAARRRRRPVIVSVGSSTSASAVPERGGDPPRSHPGPGNYLPLRRFAMWNRIPEDCRACCPDVIVRATCGRDPSVQRSDPARETLSLNLWSR